MYQLTKKDIIAINQHVGETGALANGSSLDFALHIVKQRKPWIQELSYIIRSLLADHAFQDGNKRTALALIISYCDYHHIEIDKQRIVYAIHRMAKKNITHLSKIMRLIEHGIIR